MNHDPTQIEAVDHARELAYYLRHCEFPSVDRLRAMVEMKFSLAFVWKDEGEFNEDGKFVFNEENANFEQLLVDFNTANMLVLIHDALNPENQRKFEDFIHTDDRGRFGQLVEMGWQATTYAKGADA